MTNTTTKPRHPIQVVAKRTGLSADVIRVWERRYQAVTPARSDTRRRLYTDDDVSRLTLLRRATEGGRRIGDVANLTTAELTELVESDLAARAPAALPDASPGASRSSDHLEACLTAIVALDSRALDTALSRARLDLSTPHLMEHVVLPLLHEVGERWHRGELRPHHEHLATSMTRGVLESIRALGTQPDDGPDLLVTTLSGQLHELGALMAAVVAATEGWRVTYLGPNLPAEDIAAAARQRSSSAVALSLVYPPDDPAVADQLRALRSMLPDDVPILIGGRASSGYGAVMDEVGAIVLSDYAGLRDKLGDYRSAG